jgi:hypothetical protein
LLGAIRNATFHSIDRFVGKVCTFDRLEVLQLRVFLSWNHDLAPIGERELFLAHHLLGFYGASGQINRFELADDFPEFGKRPANWPEVPR